MIVKESKKVFTCSCPVKTWTLLLWSSSHPKNKFCLVGSNISRVQGRQAGSSSCFNRKLQIWLSTLCSQWYGHALCSMAMPSTIHCRALFSITLPYSIHSGTAKHYSLCHCHALFTMALPCSIHYGTVMFYSLWDCHALFALSPPCIIHSVTAMHYSQWHCHALFTMTLPCFVR